MDSFSIAVTVVIAVAVFATTVFEPWWTNRRRRRIDAEVARESPPLPRGPSSPQGFREQVLPRIAKAWDHGCLCKAPGFLKLMSFDFSRYPGHYPMTLHEVEIIGDELIRRRFRQIGEPVRNIAVGVRTTWECPSCGGRCTETWDQYNIHFDCSVYDFGVPTAHEGTGLYVVGFFGLAGNWQVDDFRPARSVEEFLTYVGVNLGV
jgi:hypothetical protein